MTKSAWNYYGVKLIYQIIVSDDPIAERIDENYSNTHNFFEESIVLVRAQSFEHAYSIAERKARENEDTHINPYGQTVQWKLIAAIDCYLIYDSLSSGIELYSSITPAKKEMTPCAYLMQKYDYSLDDNEWNKSHNRERIRLMTLLRLEEFSKWGRKA